MIFDPRIQMSTTCGWCPECIRKSQRKQLEYIIFLYFFFQLQSLSNIILSICKRQKIIIVTPTFTCSSAYIVYFISIITDNQTLSEKNKLL